jgi:hypothetical protein
MDEVAKCAETIEAPRSRREITEAHFKELPKAD